MADAIFDQGQLGSSAQALMQRKRQLLAQEALAMGQQPPMDAIQPQLDTNHAEAAVQTPPGMSQAQFSGYPAAGHPRMTSQQAQQLARLLMSRQ